MLSNSMMHNNYNRVLLSSLLKRDTRIEIQDEETYMKKLSIMSTK